jgi:hypothetical protein
VPYVFGRRHGIPKTMRTGRGAVRGISPSR